MHQKATRVAFFIAMLKPILPTKGITRYAMSQGRHMLNFLIADNIPFADEVFASHGRIERFAGRLPEPRQLAVADVLLVRSITQVNAALLEQSPNLQFVGTATIGTEHMDLKALDARNIAYASSPGANADSVGEYILTAWLALAQKHDWKVAQQRVAIIGAGHTGQAAGRRLEALGLKVEYYDPPKAEADSDFTSMSWSRVLSADVISLHVPLTREGEHPTYHLFDTDALEQLAGHQCLLNASRGAVIDNQALLARQQQDPLTLVLDVWEGEPELVDGLIDLVDIATPHIAGHSLNGKVRGTQQLYAACRQHFDWHQQAPNWGGLMPAPRSFEWQCARMPSQQMLTQWVLQNYPIWQDDTAMREHGLSAEGFDTLRREYPVRFELASHWLQVDDKVGEGARKRLHGLGFSF